jgi:hypothetical protein
MNYCRNGAGVLPVGLLLALACMLQAPQLLLLPPLLMLMALLL